MYKTIEKKTSLPDNSVILISNREKMEIKRKKTPEIWTE